MTHMFRAIWPILDETADPQFLAMQAQLEVADLAAQAHAHITDRGRWTVEPSVSVPGSGRITEHVLMFEAPAEPMEARDYWKETA